MTASPTYHGQDFRTYPPEAVTHNGETITIQLCEELDPESRRWEPFITIVSKVQA